MAAKVSVIVPVYNVEKYIMQCLESLDNQIYDNYEVILVDDGSPDNSVQLIRDYIQGKDKFILLRKENGGVSSARNLGLRAATGEWIAFVDSDDYVENTYLSAMMQAIEQHPSDYCQTSNKIYTESTGELRRSSRCDSASGSREEMLGVLNFRYIMGKLYSAKIIRENNIWFNEEIHSGEDNSFNFMFFCYMKQCVVIPSADYVYRRHDGSSTANSIRPEKKKGMWQYARQFWNSFPDESIIADAYRTTYHLTHCIVDTLLAEIVSAVLGKDDRQFQELVSDEVTGKLLQNYVQAAGTRKEKLLVALLKGKQYGLLRVIVRIYYKDAVFKLLKGMK